MVGFQPSAFIRPDIKADGKHILIPSEAVNYMECKIESVSVGKFHCLMQFNRSVEFLEKSCWKLHRLDVDRLSVAQDFQLR